MTEEDDPPTPASVFRRSADEWEEKHERPRGMLTDTDRQFMWDVKEYPHKSTASNRRADIRERMENGLRDLSYLTMLSDRNQKRILDDLEEHRDHGALRSSIASLIEFLYLGMDGDEEWLEETLVYGIGKAENERHPDDKTYYSGGSVEAGVDVEIDIKRGYDVDEIEERLRSGHEETLTATEIGVLVREGRVSEEKLRALNSQTTERIDPETGELEDPGMNPAFGGPDPHPRDTPDPNEGEDGEE